MNTINLRVFGPQILAGYPVWHPYANINKESNSMIKVSRGEGCYLFDENNKKYLDATSGLWNMSLGYSNVHIIEKIKEQLDQLPYCSLFEHTNNRVIESANLILQECSCDMEKVFFTCSGSESIELALKLARKYWNLVGFPEKRSVISIKDSYHGTYYGSMGVSGSEVPYYSEFGNDANTVYLNFVQENGKFDKNNFIDIEQYIQKNHNKIACFVLESILASEGVQILNHDYLQWVEGLCRKYNILIIVDEVALGFYRTGTAFYFQQCGIRPDFICMSKGINSGYLPLGAVAVGHTVCETYSRFNNFIAHGSTQGGNVTACVSCIAAIEEYRTKNIEKHVNQMGEYLLEQLIHRIGGHQNVGDIRGKGLLLAIDLVNNKVLKEPLTLNQIESVQRKCQRKGLLVYVSKLGLTLLPMLIISKEEADKLVSILGMTMDETIFCE